MRVTWPSGPNPCAKATQKRLAAHKAAIAFHASGLGWTPFLHHTNRPAVEALLPLHMHLSGLEKAYRAKGTLKGQLGRGGRPVMTSGLLGTLTFTYPWMLAGLAALPVIWLLLRLTPPRPATVPFPPASLLLGLRANEKDPDPQPLVADPAADACRRGCHRRPGRPGHQAAIGSNGGDLAAARCGGGQWLGGRQPLGASGNPSPISFPPSRRRAGKRFISSPPPALRRRFRR